MAGAVTAAPLEQRGKRFLVNVLWNWMGVAASVVSGLLVSPYMLRKLGPEGYGVYTLSFAILDYYWFLDLGFRSATVKYVAHYWAREEPEKVSEVVNTAVTYAGITAALIFFAVLLGGRHLNGFFQISATYRSSFTTLVFLVSLSWCVSVVFGLFGACLEALQRFDYYNRILVIGTTVRVAGTLALLYAGFGLVQIGAMVVASQVLQYLLHYYFFRKVHRGYRISFKGANLRMLKQMGSYGIHNFVGNVSMNLQNQGAPILIGHFQPAKFVGFFQIPLKLLQYTGEAVGRIGAITNASTAELVAKGESGAISQFAIFTNRYCVAVFMPLAIFLLAYGRQFLELWVPSSAAASAPLLPVLLIAYMLAFIGQFSSDRLLMGLARYQWYSRGLAAEAGCGFIALIFVIPHYGILGAAWVVATAMILNRGLFLPWLVGRILGMGFARYMHSIFTRPVLAAIPVFALSAWLSRGLLRGTSWFELIAAGALIACLYFGLALVFCVPEEHRTVLTSWLSRKIERPKADPACA